MRNTAGLLAATALLLTGCDGSPKETFWAQYSIDGIVRDESGAGINGVELVYPNPEFPQAAPVIFVTPMGSVDGSFVIPSVRSGSHSITIRPPPGYVVPPEQPNPVIVIIRDASVSLVIVLRRS